MHGTKAVKSAPKAAPAKKPKLSKKPTKEEFDALVKHKKNAAKTKQRIEIEKQQPLSQNRTVAKQMAKAQVQLQVKALPDADTLHAAFAKQSTQEFKTSPFHYRQIPRKHADMILMDDTGSRRHEDQMIRYIDSQLLQITDPVLRETLRQEESKALKIERAKNAKISKYVMSTLSSNDKIKALIKEGANNKTILNAMYNLLPRILPTKKLRHNIDSLDWLAQVRHRWQNEIEPNGYDVEDSDDPDTLPQQRAFTRDEMHRLLQDVEESKYIESDVEEVLFAPAAAMGDLKRELQKVEIDNQLRFVLKNVHGDAVTPESFDYKTMRREFKRLLGAPTRPGEDGEDIIDEEGELLKGAKELHHAATGETGTPNELSQSLVNAIEQAKIERQHRIGIPLSNAGEIGKLDPQDFLLPGTITNAGLGLMPPMFDVMELPVHYIHDTSGKNENLDMYGDAVRPFQSRFDIACAVVLNRIMGPSGKDVPVYLTDSIDAELRLETHPAYRKANFAMLNDLKNGTKTAVDSIQTLMKEGYHPQDVMKRLVLSLDILFKEENSQEEIFLDELGNVCEPGAEAISFKGEEIDRLQEYHEFISEALRVSKVINDTEKFTAGSTTTTGKDGKPRGVKGSKPELLDSVQREGSAIDTEGAAPHGLHKSSVSKAAFNTYQIQTDEDGNFVTVSKTITDGNPEAMVARASLQAQEYGIGSVHRISPVETDLTNQLGIQTTEPLSSPFGFRPNQKTIYGKQIISVPDSMEYELGGLASREVPATRYTTDGTEITLDPHRSQEYTVDQMVGAIDNYRQKLKPILRNDQKLANQTAVLFQPEQMSGIADLALFQVKHDPNHINEDSGTDFQEGDMPNPIGHDDGQVDWAGVDNYQIDPALPIKDRAIQRVDKRNQKILAAKRRGEARAAEGLDDDDTTDSHTDPDGGVSDPELGMRKKVRFDPKDIDDDYYAPELAIGRDFDDAAYLNKIDMNSEEYREADITWSPLDNHALENTKWRLKRLQEPPESEDSKFRKLCKAKGVELTEWESKYNKMIRRVYDGEIGDQLTFAARQLTRESQIEALAPIFNDWKKVLDSDRDMLLNPSGKADPEERAYRQKEASLFGIRLSTARAQVQLNNFNNRLAFLDRPGYGAVAHTELSPEQIDELGTPVTLGVDDLTLKAPGAKKTITIKKLGDAGEVASFSTTRGSIAADGNTIQGGDVSMGEILSPVLNPLDGFQTPPSATAPHAIPHASNTYTPHTLPKYTLMDLFEGKVKLGAGGQNAPAITDFDFRNHYLKKVTDDVDAFNNKYYTREEFDSFDALVAALPDGDKLKPDQLKFLKAKSQIVANKYVHYKRNDKPYDDSDVDPITGRELKIKSLGLGDVDQPLSEELLGTIQRHHRLMLNESDSPHQINIDIDAYVNALQANGGDAEAALDVAEKESLPTEVLSKQLKRYLQAWKARDLEAESAKNLKIHDNQTVLFDENGMELTPEEIENRKKIENSAVDSGLSVDHIIRTYSRHLLGLPLHSDFHMKNIAARAAAGEDVPELRSRSARRSFELWQRKTITRQLNRMIPTFHPPDPDFAPEDEPDPWNEPDRGMPYRHIHRTPDKQYKATMDLPFDGDEIDALRETLSKDVLDPTHEDNLDDRVEWFHEPEMLQTFDHRTMTKAVNKMITGDPFVQYIDSIPEGVKTAEVLRSSFSMIPPRLLDDAIHSRRGDEAASQGRRRNAIRYNPAFSYKQLRKYRKGLEKYSGIPLYLLDFAEVAYNPHRPFFVHSSREENHLREVMTEERLRQPSGSLLGERPEDSENDIPDISTPITIGGTPASRQAAHVQSHYQNVIGSARQKRIQQFKKDLVKRRKTPQEEDLSEETALDDEELNIAQEYFKQALDRILDREATAFLTDDYTMAHLEAFYPEEMGRYQEAIRIKDEFAKAKEQAGSDADVAQPYYDDEGNQLPSHNIQRFPNGFKNTFDSSEGEEELYKHHQLFKQQHPGKIAEKVESTDSETFIRSLNDRSKVDPRRILLSDQNGDNVDLESWSEAKSLINIKHSSKVNPFFMNDFSHGFFKHLEAEENAKNINTDSFAYRLAQVQSNRLHLFDEDFKLTPLMQDPLGAEESTNMSIFFDRRSDEALVEGRWNQSLRALAEGYLRHRRAVAAGMTSGDWVPHDFEIGWTFEHIYGKHYWETDEERSAARSEYRAFVRQTRLPKLINGVEVGTDDEFSVDTDASDAEAQIAEQMALRKSTRHGVDQADVDADTKVVGVEASDADTPAEPTPASLSEGDEKDEKVDIGFDAGIAEAVEAEIRSEAAAAAAAKPKGRVRQGTAAGLKPNQQDEADVGTIEDFIAEERQFQDNMDLVREVAIENATTLKHPVFPDNDILAGPKTAKKIQKIFNLSWDGFDILPFYGSLDHHEKVQFLTTLLELRQRREQVSARREDIVATVYGTQRQLMRRLTDELQLSKRSERTAFKRIFALDPHYARQLVTKHLLYATGRRQEDDEYGLPLEINWKVELNYVEEIMWSSANRLNARTGGMFPGTPGVARAHDPTFFTPPALIGGEFAPMFIDQHMISSDDEMVEAHARLPYYGNADFVPCGVTQYQKLGKARSSTRNDIVRDNDTKPSFNTRRDVPSDFEAEAKMQILSDFSAYEFTSDAEQQFIDNNLAQLHLDTATNLAFASAISSHRSRLDKRRAKIEVDHPLIYGHYDPNHDYRAGSIYADDTPAPKAKDGSLEGAHTYLRHRLKRLMRGRESLDRNPNSRWAGLFADAEVDFNEDGTMGDGTQAFLDGLSKLIQRTSRVNALSSGNILTHRNDDTKGPIIPHDMQDVAHFFKTDLSGKKFVVADDVDDNFDVDGTVTNNLKAHATKGAQAALAKAKTMKAKTDTDVLGEVVSFIPTKYAKIDAKKIMAEDPDMKAAVLTEQAYNRYLGANTLLQANALTLKLAEEIDATNDLVLDELGTNLLTQKTMDRIVYQVFGGKGGAPIYPTTEEFIEPFVKSPEQIIGELLPMRPNKSHKYASEILPYNAGRTLKQEQEDLKKIEAGEMTEWTEYEEFETENEEHLPKSRAPHVVFALAIRNFKYQDAAKWLPKLDVYDNQEIAPHTTAAPTHPELANKEDRPSILSNFDPLAHHADKKSAYLIPAKKSRIPRVLLTTQDPIFEEFPQLKSQVEDAINIDSLEIEIAPGGEAVHPRPLNLPDNATDPDVEVLEKLDAAAGIARPTLQYLPKRHRDHLNDQLPTWLRNAQRSGNYIRQHINQDGELVTELNPDMSGVTNTTQRTVEALVDDDGISRQTLRPNLPSKMRKTLRNRHISPQEAIAMGLDPNEYESELTRLQQGFLEERMDQFFAASKLAEEEPELVSNRYLRSFLMYSGLRKLEADPEIGAKLVTAMVHGADLEDESVLYRDMNVKGLYHYIRGIEKEDKLQRHGVLEKYHELIDSGLSKEELAKDENNPLALTKRTDADRVQSPILDLIRDIVSHAEVYGQITSGKGAPQETKHTYHPFKSITSFNKYKREAEDYSANETDFEDVNVVTVDPHQLGTVQNPTADDINKIHTALVTTKKSLNGLSIVEVEKIFNICDTTLPPVLRQVTLELLSEYLAAYPQNKVVLPALHVEDPTRPFQNLTGHPLRAIQTMQAIAEGDERDPSYMDPAKPRAIVSLEEIDLSLVNMKKRFAMEHGNALPESDLTEFNKIILDCAREGRIYYPKPKVHEAHLIDQGSAGGDTPGFDTEALAIGALEAFKPEDLRYSSDTVTLDTFNRIMSMPTEKMLTFLKYQTYIDTHARLIAHKSFFSQLARDIRAVRPVAEHSMNDVADAQRVHSMYKNRTQFDSWEMGPGGYMRSNVDHQLDDSAMLNVSLRTKYGRIKNLQTFDSRKNAYDPETEDPAYNMRNFETDAEVYDVHTKDLVSDFYRDMYTNIPTDLFTDMGDDSGPDWGDSMIQEVEPGDRPDDVDLGRRFLNMQHWLADPLSPRQVKIMRQLYEARKLEAFWSGTMSPFDSAEVYNNLRMADKMIDADTHMDHDRELARLHREIVVGVVREILDDQDVFQHSLEFDSYNLEPDLHTTRAHFDHINVFAARRFSPYTTLPLSESNIPPLIGIEQQRNIYNLHLLDPVTFHPRWLARRLNISYSQCIAMLKIYDFRHKVNMSKSFHDDDSNYHEAVDGIDDLPINPDFDNTDLVLPNPPEIQFGQMDEEYLYSRFAPNLIGRVSWTKSREREDTRTDAGFRESFGSQDMFGGDHVAKTIDLLEDRLNRRYMEEEQMLDALEQASFARFGPITFGTTKHGQLHRPPKMPREIISSSLHPPSRNNWALTTLDEAKNATYGIMIRDRDGYLRHPTYREFRAVRFREKDRRTPFFYRRHHVLGKLPEISSLFIDQVTQIKKDFEAKTSLAKDMRSSWDIKFIRQIEHTPVADLEDVDRQDLRSDDSEDFNHMIETHADNAKKQGRHAETTLRARDWLGDYTKEERYGQLTDSSDGGVDNPDYSVNKFDARLRLPMHIVDTLTPIQLALRAKMLAVMDNQTGKKKQKQGAQADDSEDETVRFMEAFDQEELAELELPAVPPVVASMEEFSPQHYEFFELATREEAEEWISGSPTTRRDIVNTILTRHLREQHPHLIKGLPGVDTDSEEIGLEPITAGKDNTTIKNIMRRQAAAQGNFIPMESDPEADPEPHRNPVTRKAQKELDEYRELKRGFTPTPEMYHYQRILSRQRGVTNFYNEPNLLSESMSELEAVDPFAPPGSSESERVESSEEQSDIGFAGQGTLMGDFYNKTRNELGAVTRFHRKAHQFSENEHSTSDNDLIAAALDGGLDLEAIKKQSKEAAQHPIFDAVNQIADKSDPNYQKLVNDLRYARHFDWDTQANPYFSRTRPDILPALLTTDHIKHYMNSEDEALEHAVSGSATLGQRSYIATVRPIRTKVGVQWIDPNEEIRGLFRDTPNNKYGNSVPISPGIDFIERMVDLEQDPLNKQYAADIVHTEDSEADEYAKFSQTFDSRMAEEKEQDSLALQQLQGGDKAAADKESDDDKTVTEKSESDDRDNIHRVFGRPTSIKFVKHPLQHNPKSQHMRAVSEDAFYDAEHQGADMYQEVYGIPRERMNKVQLEQIQAIRGGLNSVRAQKLELLGARAMAGEAAKYQTLRKALFDPNQEMIKAKNVAYIPSSVETDPQLAAYLQTIEAQNQNH